MSWPLASTCGSRPGEKIKSLARREVRSIAEMMLGVAIGAVEEAAADGAAGGAVGSKVSFGIRETVESAVRRGTLRTPVEYSIC